MRKGILGSIAAIAAGAGTAWGQPAMPAGDPPAPAAVAPASDTMLTPASGVSTPPAPVIMPPLSVGPTGDPQGLGPAAGFGPPPGPMYPNPGPYAAPLFQPAPPGAGGGAGQGGASGGAPHWWWSADYLLYYSKSQPLPIPLITTSAPSDRGLLGRPSTLVLLGNEDISYNPFSGFRVTAGFFGDADRRYGFEASGFWLEERSKLVEFVSSPTGIPTLARPFIDSANLQGFDSLVVANPGLGDGSLSVESTSQTWSVEANAVVNLFRSPPGCSWSCSIDFLAGYRFLELEESLTILSSTNLNIPPVLTPVFTTGPFGVITQSTLVPTPVPFRVAGITVFSPATIDIRDNIRTQNRFNGGQVGLRSEVRYGMFTLALSGKLGFGHMHQVVDISGDTSITDPTIVSAATARDPRTGFAFGGLYANASNIGRYNHDEFVIIPEANVNLGLNITRGLTGFIGYNFLYIDNVVRPGTQLNPIVNTATVPASPNYGALNRPGVVNNLFEQDEFWLMGVNFGFMLRY